MPSFSKQAEISTTFIVTLSLGLVFLLIAVLFVAQLSSFATVDFFSQSSCWSANTVKCGGGALADIIPNLCSFETIEESLDEEALAAALRNVWWMYKEGTCDLGSAVDEVYPIFAFSPSNDIDLQEFIEYLITHNRGKEIKEGSTNSDYNYFEENTRGQALCFDNSDESINNLYLDKGETYFIIYYDDQELIGEDYNDAILITTDPSFDQDPIWNMYKEAGFEVITTQLELITPDKVPILGGGKIELGGPLEAGEEEFARIANIDQDDYEGCLVYGPTTE
tara:strand:- start:2664 stop:3503 length:840 start_codon:yes stop_codon:yes gene_type:complete